MHLFFFFPKSPLLANFFPKTSSKSCVSPIICLLTYAKLSFIFQSENSILTPLASYHLLDRQISPWWLQISPEHVSLGNISILCKQALLIWLNTTTTCTFNNLMEIKLKVISQFSRQKHTLHAARLKHASSARYTEAHRVDPKYTGIYSLQNRRVSTVRIVSVPNYTETKGIYFLMQATPGEHSVADRAKLFTCKKT